MEQFVNQFILENSETNLEAVFETDSNNLELNIYVRRIMYKCGECGATGVRLYRPYGNFYRPESNRCNKHLSEDQRGVYVPLWTSLDGIVWGYTSVRQDAFDRFIALPENDPTDWVWARYGWKKDGLYLCERYNNLPDG
jgi:hypothetical protein